MHSKSYIVPGLSNSGLGASFWGCSVRKRSERDQGKMVDAESLYVLEGVRLGLQILENVSTMEREKVVSSLRKI